MNKVFVILGAVLAVGCSSSMQSSTTGGSGTTSAGSSGSTTGGTGATTSTTAGGSSGTSGAVDAGPVGPLNCGTPPAADSSAVTGFVSGNTQFAFELLGQLAPADGGGSGNVFVAPYSVSTAMAMLYAGAGSQTATDIATVMHFPGDAGVLAKAVGALDCQLLSDGAGPDGGHLVPANGFFVDQNFGLRPSYQATLQDDFGATAQTVNFAGDPAGSEVIINDWVSHQTQGLIPHLLQPNQVDATVVLVLVNTLDFVGSWQSSFPDATSGTFRRADGSTVTAPMMSSSPYWAGFYAPPGYKVLELATQSRIAVDFILPDADDGLPALVAQLTPAELDNDFGQLQVGEVDVKLPKLNLDYSKDLVRSFRALSLNSPFDPGADFSGIGSGDLLVEFIQHEAALQLNEVGLHAAGATAIGVGTTGGTGAPPTNVFHADHPFLIVIRDVDNGALLFLGEVQDPSQH